MFSRAKSVLDKLRHPSSASGSGVSTSNDSVQKNPPYGRRLIPHVVDDLAASEPNRTWAYIPNSVRPEDGWTPVTFKEYANSINRVAAFLTEQLDRRDGFPTIAYIGPSDVRYAILFGAAIKAGFKILFPSPRNNPESQTSLFNATQCTTLFHAEDVALGGMTWIQDASIKTISIGSPGQLLDSTPVPHVPYTKTFEEAEWDTVAFLHTSGSTGTPKPITVRNGLFAISDAYQNHPTWQGYEFMLDAMVSRSDRFLTSMPMFHAFGLYLLVGMSIFRASPTMFANDMPMTADNILKIIKYSNCNGVAIAPSILAEIASSDDTLDGIRNIKSVMTGGGALPKESGDRLVKANIPLCNGISSTEAGMYPIYWNKRPELWQYFVYNDNIFNCEYREIEPGLYEQIIRRKAQSPGLQGIFYSFPDIQEYKTGDIYEQHPEFPELWKSCGRIDDVIVFSNGEKLNPVTIEATVARHPEVKSALVVGAGRFQAGMFIEPLDTTAEGLLDRIWPTIEAINAETVSHGRIAKHLVRLASPDKPFLYSAKGSLRKGAMVKYYKDEIEDLYTQEVQSAKLDLGSQDTLQSSLKGLLELVDIKGDDDADFALLGVDSLQVINAAKMVTASLKKAGSDIQVQPRNIYSNPSISQLSSFIFGKLSNSDEGHNEEAMLKGILDKYSTAAPVNTSKKPAAMTGQTVIVTGTTGSLGSYLLDQLAREPRIARIICLNRSTGGGKAKQVEGNAQRGLDTTLSKAEFYQADLSQPDFGIANYSELLECTDRIIHNAWPVNFNFAVSAFIPHIQGVKNMIDFAAKCTKNVHISFMSSIGTTDQWAESRPVPEEQLTDLTLPAMGYGQSKLISSILLHDSPIPTAVIRVGQIAGPKGSLGEWNRQEWLPTIIEASAKLGVLPDSLGTLQSIDWVPVEDVANSILDISGCTSDKISQGYFNLVNPKSAAWSELASTVQMYYAQHGKQLKLVSLDDWVAAVESGEDTNAVKLLDTYKNLAAGAKAGKTELKFATDRSQEASETMKNMAPVTAELMNQWCQQWSF